MHFVNHLTRVMVTLINYDVLITNRVAINIFRTFFRFVCRTSRPVARLSFAFGSLRDTLTDTRHIFSLLSRPRVRTSPLPSRTTGLPNYIRNHITFRRIHFNCAPRGPLVYSISFATRPNRGVTIIKAANTNGAALVGLLVHFCRVSNNHVALSNISAHRVSHNRLHRRFNVILRST